MATYSSLLDGTEFQLTPPPVKEKKKPRKDFKRGCEGCPLNKEGCVKIIGLSRVTGKKIFIWAQSPGYKETQFIYEDAEGRKRRGMELIGPSGEFLWKHLSAVGIKREHCDIQNVVRCRPTEWDEEKRRYFDRKPAKEEIRHCSIYTDKAIEKAGGKAKVHIVLGLVAAQALLGKEFKKGHTVFWSERLGAKVICIAHPAYFLRSGYAKTKLGEFKAGIKAAAEILTGSARRFAFVESQNFGPIKKLETFREFAGHLKEASRKHRVVVDIEDGPRDGRRVLLCAGFCFEPGYARTVYLDKTDVQIDDRAGFLETFHKLFRDEKIRWIAHHAVHERKHIPLLKGFKGVTLKNLDYDTEYAEYIYDSSRGSYSLAEIAEARFPEYAGYKDMIVPYVGSPKEYDPTRDYDKIPEKVMTIYNGADCTLAKEIERTTSKKISLPLLHVYMDASVIFDEMNRKGPHFDLEHCALVESVIPKKVKVLTERLALLALDSDFNPGSPVQVKKLLYGTLGLDPVKNKKGKITSDADAIAYLKQFHQAPGLVEEYRLYSKMDSTYLKAFRASAEQFGGEVRTIWWLTGTVTGRLRSGRGKG